MDRSIENGLEGKARENRGDEVLTGDNGGLNQCSGSEVREVPNKRCIRVLYNV